MNKIIAIIAILLLALILLKGLAYAWVGMRILSFIFIILTFVGVGWIWGRFSK